MKSTLYSTNLLKLIFQNVALAGYGDVTGVRSSSTAGSFYVGLHTGDPGLTDDQTVNEATYTGYARQAVARSSGGWSVTSGVVSNNANVTFDPCTGGSNIITHFSVGTASSGAGHCPYSFPLISSYFDCVAVTSGNLITAPGHSLVVNDPIEFVSAPGGVLPGGISIGTIYYVKTVSSDTFTISATLGGSTLTISSDGSVIVGKIATLAVSSGITPQFLAGQLTITES
jgi:hypothetical protein